MPNPTSARFDTTGTAAKARPRAFKSTLRVPSHPMKKTPLAKESAKHKVRGKTWRKSYDLHLSTGDVQCRAKLPGCYGRAEVPHHIIKRQWGGGDDPSNILPVCHNCHGAIHADEAGAIILGLLRRPVTVARKGAE